jgi:hypothetical protein
MNTYIWEALKGEFTVQMGTVLLHRLCSHSTVTGTEPDDSQSPAMRHPPSIRTTHHTHPSSQNHSNVVNRPNVHLNTQIHPCEKHAQIRNHLESSSNLLTMWILRLTVLFSSLVWALGDIEAYGDYNFDEVTRTGKHFIQFWDDSCENSRGMINDLFKIDTALGQGAEDIWVGRIDWIRHPGLTERFGILKPHTYIYVVGNKYYKYRGTLMPDPILEYVRSGFLKDDALDVPQLPPLPKPVPEIPAEIVPPTWLEEFLDRVFGEPELRLTERKSVIALRKGVTVALLAAVVLKALFGGRKEKKESTGNGKKGKTE